MDIKITNLLSKLLYWFFIILFTLYVVDCYFNVLLNIMFRKCVVFITFIGGILFEKFDYYFFVLFIFAPLFYSKLLLSLCFYEFILCKFYYFYEYDISIYYFFPSSYNYSFFNIYYFFSLIS